VNYYLRFCWQTLPLSLGFYIYNSITGIFTIQSDGFSSRKLSRKFSFFINLIHTTLVGPSTKIFSNNSTRCRQSELGPMFSPAVVLSAEAPENPRSWISVAPRSRRHSQDSHKRRAPDHLSKRNFRDGMVVSDLNPYDGGSRSIHLDQVVPFSYRDSLVRSSVKSINQSNQSINQSINQSLISQSIKRSINQSLGALDSDSALCKFEQKSLPPPD
jgi:hypothetical protein